MNSLKKPVQDFTHFLINNEVEDVIICPGSRNAPFIIDLANHPKIKAYSIIDERSAAFFALGIAQQKKKPARCAASQKKGVVVVVAHIILNGKSSCEWAVE